MRTTTTLALAATTALIGLGTTTASAFQAAEPDRASVREKGIVLECTGSVPGLEAYVDLYENNRYANYFQVILNQDPALASSREPADLWHGKKVRGSVRVDGHRARVTGTASKVGGPFQVHEEYDDAGQHVVAHGTHQRLRNRLVLRYAGAVVPLICDPAFFYKLDVTKTDITGD